MSEADNIPLLRELIQRGQHSTDARNTGPQADTINDALDKEPKDESVHFHSDDEIEQQYHAALQEIQASQQALELQWEDSDDDEDKEPDYQPDQQRDQQPDEQLDPAPDIRELLIDEEIRMILQRHMDRAYEEIITLISHKVC